MKKSITLILLTFCFYVHCADVIIFATYPSNSTDKVQRAFIPLTEYLAEKTGKKVELVITSNYDELSKRLKDGTVDIAWIGSKNYIKTKKEIPELNYLVTYLEYSSDKTEKIPYYHSYIISLKKSGFTNLKHIQNKRFAFTDKTSTSGYAYPMMVLRNAGIKPEAYFSKVFFLKKHDKVVKSLIHGSIDAGAISDGTYITARKEYGDIFNIIVKSEEIPLDAIVTAPGFSQKQAEIFKKILLELPAEHPLNQAILDNLGWKSAGFEDKGDEFYNSLRKALEIK